MLNVEKFKDEIIEEYQNLLKKTVIDGDGNRMNKAIKTIAYKHYGKRLCGASSTFKWLCEEYKEPIKVSKLEYDILKYLVDYTKYLYITRDRCNGLFLYGMEPSKGDGCWHGESYAGITSFNKLFQFVQWEDEEPTSIEDVLGNCEVIDGE